MTKRKSGYFESARRMPPLRHSIPGKEFDIMNSQVVEWLVQRPTIRQKVFEMAKDRGVIVYDRETGTWRGVDYAD